MARGTLLDLPDEAGDAGTARDRGLRRGVVLATAVPVLWLALGIVAARTFALGGLPNHWLIVGGLLGGGAALLSWLLIGPGEQRTLWAVAFLVIGLALVPVASSGATPSVGRLSHMADDLGLPGRVVREDGRKGNGRCRPACSELHRVVVSETSSFTKVRTQVSNALKQHGYLVHVYGTSPTEPQRMTATSKKAKIEVVMLRTSTVRTTIELFLFAQGPEGSSQIG